MKTASNQLKPIPSVGIRYNHYDDGKIRPSRHYVVEIINVIPYSETDKSIRKNIIKEQKECDWLYADTTDYVVFAKDTNNEDYIYIRTKDGGWFSIASDDSYFNCGRLDVDHSLTDMVIEDLHKGYYDYTPEGINEIINEFV